jgi:hypothetical protein
LLTGQAPCNKALISQAQQKHHEGFGTTPPTIRSAREDKVTMPNEEVLKRIRARETKQVEEVQEVLS